MATSRKKRRKTRGLVVGYLERVSGDVFDKRSDAITELAGNRPGVYALYKNNTLYYVGLARRLRGRVKDHLRDRHAGKWNLFNMYFVRSESHMKDLESLAIRIAYPKGNKTRGKFGGAPDLRKVLRKRMLHSAIEEIDVIMGHVSGPANGRSKSPKSAADKAWRTRRKEAKDRLPVLKGLLTDKALRMDYKGKQYRAWINRSGTIRLKHTGEVFDSPSSAAEAVRRKSSNGWYWWRFKDNQGEWQRLQALRRKR